MGCKQPITSSPIHFHNLNILEHCIARPSRKKVQTSVLNINTDRKITRENTMFTVWRSQHWSVCPNVIETFHNEHNDWTAFCLRSLDQTCNCGSRWGATRAMEAQIKTSDLNFAASNMTTIQWLMLPTIGVLLKP